MVSVTSVSSAELVRESLTFVEQARIVGNEELRRFPRLARPSTYSLDRVSTLAHPRGVLGTPERKTRATHGRRAHVSRFSSSVLRAREQTTK